MIDWRIAIETQVCPLCGRGPFLILARHLNARHDIDRFELRELAGLPKSTKGVCAPDHSEACHDRSIAQDQAAALPHRKGPRGKLDWSEAGRQRLRETDPAHRIAAAAKLKLAKTHCRHGHPYSMENTRIGPVDGDRICRTCQREADVRWRGRQGLKR